MSSIRGAAGGDGQFLIDISVDASDAKKMIVIMRKFARMNEQMARDAEKNATRQKVAAKATANAWTRAYRKIGRAKSLFAKALSNTSKLVDFFASVIKKAATVLAVVFGVQVIAATALLFKLGKAVIHATQKYREFLIVLKGSTGSTKRAKDLANYVREMALRMPVTVDQLQRAVQSASVIPALKARFIAKDFDDVRDSVKELADSLVYLSALNPNPATGGPEGAMFAIREAMAGQFRSLRQRFDINPNVIAKSIGKSQADLKADPSLILKAITAFGKQNIGEESVKELSNLPSVIFGNLKAKIDDMWREVGEKGFFDGFVSMFRGFEDKLAAFSKTEMFADVTEQMSDALSRAFANLMDLGKTLMDEFIEIFAPTAGGDRIARFFIAIGNAVEDAAEKFRKLVAFLQFSVPAGIATVKAVGSVVGTALGQASSGLGGASGIRDMSVSVLIGILDAVNMATVLLRELVWVVKDVYDWWTKKESFDQRTSGEKFAEESLTDPNFIKRSPNTKSTWYTAPGTPAYGAYAPDSDEKFGGPVLTRDEIRKQSLRAFTEAKTRLERKLAELIKDAARREAEHADAVNKALGAKKNPASKFDFGPGPSALGRETRIRSNVGYDVPLPGGGLDRGAISGVQVAFAEFEKSMKTIDKGSTEFAQGLDELKMKFLLSGRGIVGGTFAGLQEFGKTVENDAEMAAKAKETTRLALFGASAGFKVKNKALLSDTNAQLAGLSGGGGAFDITGVNRTGSDAAPGAAFATAAAYFKRAQGGFEYNKRDDLSLLDTAIGEAEEPEGKIILLQNQLDLYEKLKEATRVVSDNEAEAVEIQQAFDQSGIATKIIELQAEISSTREGMRKEDLKKIKADLEAEKKIWEDFASSVKTTIEGSLGDALFDGLKNGFKNLNNIVQSMGESIIKMFIQVGLRKAMSGALGGALFGGAADGGVFHNGIKMFANGSPRVATPTYGVVGEGPLPEAVIPLPDGRRVPVDMRGGQQGGATKVVVMLEPSEMVKQGIQADPDVILVPVGKNIQDRGIIEQSISSVRGPR